MNKINIIYLNNTEKFASGGSKIIYDHSRIINTYYLKKFNSEILHIKKKKVSKYINSLTKRFFKSKDYGWKFSDICASKNFKGKLSKDDIKFENSLNFNYQKDFIIIPEIYAHFAEDLCIKNRIKYAIICLNGYSINFTSDYNKLLRCYNGAEFILSISNNTTQCIQTIFPKYKKKIIKINLSCGIKYKNIKKKNIITYMPRKLSDHSSKLLFFLKPNLPKNWKIIELSNNMTTEEVYQWLSKSKIFLSFSDMEGLGLPPIEAAISGNKVIGYTGEGGREYWKKPIFQEIPKGNIILFTKTILKNLDIVNNNWLKKNKNLRDAISEQYSHDKQLSFLNLILKKIYNIYK